ncbi:MAG: hypothetical protein M3N59_00560 [bacterium]|nr:hypothetical protein [bacterium]
MPKQNDTPNQPAPAPQTPEDAKGAPTTQADAERPLLAWQTKEFQEFDRNRRWYAVALVLGAVLVTGALVLQQWLAAAVFALATYVVVRHADDKPRLLSVAISKLGVEVGGTFHPYSELKTYWIIYKPPVKTLTIQSTNRYRPLIKVNLEDVDPLAVQGVLKDHLPEQQKQTEDFIDKFSRWIRL